MLVMKKCWYREISQCRHVYQPLARKIRHRDHGRWRRAFPRATSAVGNCAALIADPPVMILDEATSSIDTRTERIVQSGMDRLMSGRTVFVIAHRLSTIQNSDAIMVMDHGRIIERGTHETLLAEKGTYYQLYTGKIELD